MPLTQENRPAGIATPLDQDTPSKADALCLVSFTGHEELGRLFEYEVELASEDFNVDFDKIIGGNVTVRLDTTAGTTRYFNGIVSRFTQRPNSGQYASYQATIVPWLWLLTRTSDCRIWSGSDSVETGTYATRTVPEILKALFTARGFTDFDDSKLTATYTPWEFCVQYRETDFNFVSRLMEQEGIYYFFTHDNGKHTLVLADSASAHAAFPGYDPILYRPPSPGSSDVEFIRDWSLRKELHSGSFVHTDFDFQNPAKDLRTDPAIIPRQYDNSKFEIFDYPGEFVVPGDGTQWASVRIQELQTRYQLVHGQADARGLAAGYTFTLQDVPRDDQNQQYLTVSVSHSIQSPLFDSRGGGAGEDPYHCSFSVLPTTEVFRPARLTPKPLVQGPQTAIVVGTKGEEIYTDKYGRVKLQFHWDRYGSADQNSSCWVRVSHAWAGKQWGAIYLPRIGHEVIVEFLEGDPDQPIITGRVYNAGAMPPYPLPAQMTKSTLKSSSSKGGQGFNELRFEDAKGSEQIFLHAEYNQDIRVKNDCKEWIGNDRHLIVINDQFEHVENNRHDQVDADHMEKVGQDRSLDVVGKEAVQIGGNKSLTVKGDVNEVFQGNHSEQTTKDCYVVANNVVIEGKTNVTIKVGQSYIAIESSGITIGTTGTLDLQSTGALSAQSNAQAQISSPQTTVSGDSMVTIKGATVKIN